MDRRLAAILAADVVGYSRLMEEDEAGTLAALRAHREELIEPKIAAHHGRTVKLMGDGALVEFASVVDAVKCAVEIQRQMLERNKDVAADKRIAFRIGVHLGDVIVEDDDIYGDGVNVAARLEGLAEPAGVCLSQQAYDQVETKLDLDYEDLGDQQVKNIARPVRAFRVHPHGRRAKPARLARRGSARTQWIGAMLAVLLIVTAGTLAWWRPWAPERAATAIDRVAAPVPAKPSIAVLPFDNMSKDPEQDYFADGIAEDLITDLSKISALFVIARNSTFTYKDKAVDVKQVGRELGVRYVLEGSVRRFGDQVRVNAQLIDAVTGGHLWAERYDGSLDNVFALQDRLTRQIVAALAINLTSEDVSRKRPETENPEAYDAFLRGWTFYRRGTHDDYARAREYFERALELDPGYSRALAALAATYWESFRRDWYTAMKMSRHETRLRAEEYLERALVTPTPLAFQVSSKMLVWRGKHEEAVAEARKAVALAPNDSEGHITLAEMLIWAGEPEEALGSIELARRLDPHSEGYHAYVKGLAEFALGSYRDAAISLERALDLNPDFLMAGMPLAVVYANLDRIPEARAAVKPYCEDVWCQNAPTEAHWFPFKREQDLRRFIEGLVRAGLHE